MAAVFTFLQDALKVRPEEARRTTLAFTYLFCAIGSFILARISRTTLFLEIPNYKEQLPLTYLGIAVTVSLVMYAYARFERRLRRDVTNAVTLAAVVALTLGFRILLSLAHGWGEDAVHSIYWAYYIWVEVLGTFLIVQFWSFANEIFHSRQAKRLFAVIGGGGVLANVAVGFGLSSAANAIGTENLLYVICALLSACFFLVRAIGREARTELTAAKERAPAKKSTTTAKEQRVFATRHVQLIALVVVLTYVVSTVTDYQFNVIVGDSIPGKDERTAYFGMFFGITGVIGGVIQFTLTSRILERFGVLFALVLLPIAMLFGSVAVGVVPLTALLWAMSYTKGSENVLRYTVNDSTLQLLYLPVPSNLRGLAKAFIDGILKPISIGGTGLVLALLVGKLDRLTGIEFGFNLSTSDISWIAVAGLAAWIVALVFLRREYLKSLMQTLHRRRLNFADAGFEIHDEGTIKTLERAFASGVMGEILHALELLPHVARKARETLNPKVSELLRHESRDVRVAVLNYLAESSSGYADAVEPLLDDGSRDVRAAAVRAYCAALREKATPRIQDLLGDYDRKVQAAAVAGLIRHGGLDGVLSCATLLKRWLESREAGDRAHAAWVLGEVGVQTFYQPLVPLLTDPSMQVRLAAVTAAGKLRSPDLIAPLINELEHPQLRGAASAALAAYGRQVEDILGPVIADRNRHLEVRTQACKILARLGDSRSAEILTDHLADADIHIRGAAAHALASIANRLPGLLLRQDAIDAAMSREAQSWFELLAIRLDLELDEEATLLRDTLEHRQRLGVAHIFGLLAIKYPHQTIDLVTRNLASKDATNRANAIEVLDNLLPKDEKAYLIPMLDDATADKTLAVGVELFKLERRDRASRLVELLQHADPWLRSAAALEAARAPDAKLLDAIRDLVGSPDAVCRETALVALQRREAMDELLGAARKLLDDPIAHVQRYARFVLGEHATESATSG